MDTTEEESPYSTIVARLTSIDANDRVKAAAELGEVGTEREAPHLLKAVWEDEASTVRQIAIQAYAEIMKDASFNEIYKAATEHPDRYVRLYAISVLGNILPEIVGDSLYQFLEGDDHGVHEAAVRALIHLNMSDSADRLLTLLNNDTDIYCVQSISEAIALWKYKKGKKILEQKLNTITDNETRIWIKFALASLGVKKYRDELENDDIDPFIRIKYNDEWYRGKDGILNLIDKLSK